MQTNPITNTLEYVDKIASKHKRISIPRGSGKLAFVASRVLHNPTIDELITMAKSKGANNVTS